MKTMGYALLMLALSSGGVYAASGQAAPASAGPVPAEMLEDLVAANRILVEKGVIDIRGHVSVRHPRDPQRFIMSRAMAPELVTPADVVEYDLEGQAVDAKGRESFSERFIHSEVYKARPDVMAVVHAHTPSVVSFASSDVVLRPVIISANYLGSTVPAFKNGLAGGGIGRPELGKTLAEALGSGPAVMMVGHGVVVVAFSLPAAVGRAVYLDVNAQILARTLAMGGKPVYNLPPADNPALKNTYDREWEAWKRKAMAPARQR
jgi:ribulose-5-phosphate 4-epimerase/fuculose-1-phosphate aldolase